MAREIVKVVCKKDGTVEVSTEGMAGKKCTEATADLEVLLGKKNGKTELTADYYKPDGKAPEEWIKRT